MKSLTAVLILALLGISVTAASGRILFPRSTSPSYEPRGADTQPSSLEQQIVSKEREGLDALHAGNVQRFSDLTDENDIFIDAQGPASKDQLVKNVTGFIISEYSMDDLKFVALSKDSGLISYKIHEKGIAHGKEFDLRGYVSSIWTKKGKNWLCTFSQETGAR